MSRRVNLFCSKVVENVLEGGSPFVTVNIY